MLEPLKQFICDTCHQVIETPEDGWLEWLTPSDEKLTYTNQGFRICHHNGRCEKYQRHLDCSDNNLTDYVGELGLILLYQMMDIGKPFEIDYKGPRVKDFREFTELLRRFTIPYYEEARQYWQEAISDGYLQQYTDVNIYKEYYLKAMIEHYSN